MIIPRTPVEPTRSAGRSAALVSVATLASRVMGLVRTLVVTSVLGVTFLGNTYSSANALPNLLFEIIVGGAVAAALLPALAAVTDRSQVNRIASAVLNRALIAMTPVVLAGIVLREPLMRALTAAVADPGVREREVAVGSALLIMFLPQLWLYVIGVVLTGVLHSRHRFAAPALAPLLSSLVVTASYLLYGLVEGADAGRLELVSSRGLLILGLGTTVGVAVLSLSLLPAALKAGFRWGAGWSIPQDARSRLRPLIAPAVVTVGVQQVFLAGVLVLANSVSGGVVAYQLAFTTLLVFWAVFPLPVATTLFPGLAAAAGDRVEFARLSAEAGTRVTTVAMGAAALMVVLAGPLADLVVELGASGAGPDTRRMIALTIAAFGPGLAGYGLYALYTRAAYAASDGRSPAVAALVGFGTGLGANIVAAGILDGFGLITALAGGFSLGIGVAAALLMSAFRRRAGAQALRGVAPAMFRGLGAGLAAAGAGLAAAYALAGGSVIAGLVRAGVAGTVAIVTFVLLVAVLGDQQVRGLLRVPMKSAPGTGS